VWDLNPKYNDDNEPRKVIRGGSWKDVAYYLETGTRTFEYQDSANAYLGFRLRNDLLGPLLRQRILSKSGILTHEKGLLIAVTDV
jgi:hypothetical protein